MAGLTDSNQPKAAEEEMARTTTTTVGGPAGEFPAFFFCPQKFQKKSRALKTKKKAAGHGLTGRPILSTAFIPFPFPPPNLANNFIPLTRESAISRNATA
jgi:hypothetical protein